METQGVRNPTERNPSAPLSPSLAQARICCRLDRAILASSSTVGKGKTGHLYHTVIDNSQYVDGLRYANIVQ